jgi:hypothetical protein
MTVWAQHSTVSPGYDSGNEEREGKETGTTEEHGVEYITSRSVQIFFDKAWLADETDVDRYLESMREALLKEIRKGKRIQI